MLGVGCVLGGFEGVVCTYHLASSGTRPWSLGRKTGLAKIYLNQQREFLFLKAAKQPKR